VRAVVSASPGYAHLARREMDAVLPPGVDLAELAPGVWLLSAPGRFADRSEELGRTVFVRHCCPADREVALPTDQGAFVREALPAELPPGLQVQVRILPGGPAWPPGTLAAAVRQALRGRGSETVGGPAEHVLSIVVGTDSAFVGWGPARQNLSPWPGGIARLRRDPAEISRSARKLEEALLLFGIDPQAGQNALDLGASPGGYTGFLLGRGLRVVAVDTGALSPRLAGAPGLTFLQGAAHGMPLPPGPFDLLTADLSWDPLRAAECALRFLPRLTPAAHGVFTIKFFGGDPLETVARVRRQLEKGYRVLAVRHLFHDRGEATAHLQATPGAAG